MSVYVASIDHEKFGCVMVDVVMLEEYERLADENARLKAEIQQLKSELAQAKAREQGLKHQLSKVIEYLDVDNLTMQTVYRNAKQAIEGGGNELVQNSSEV